MEEQLIRLDEINPCNVLRDLIRNAWVVVLVVASLLLCVDTYEKNTFQPEYASEATFMVSAKGNSSAYSNMSLTSTMAETFSELFKSGLVRQRVEQKLGAQLDGAISTRIISNTNLMIVRVVASSPENAFLGLKTLIEVYPEISQEILPNAVLDVLKEPRVPTSPANYFNTGHYKKMALVLGFGLSVGLICLLSILRDTVQTPAAAKRKVDSRLLATLRHERKNKTVHSMAKKKNIAPLVSNPLVSKAFREEHQSLCSTLEYHMRKHNQKVLLISSAGENEGKSTVAANIALGLAGREKKVALLDCDFRKPAVHKIFQSPGDENHDLGYYLNHDGISDDLLIFLPRWNLHVAVNRSGYKHPQRLFTSGKLKRYLDKLRKEFDYIVVDTPPMTVAADTEALAAYVDVSMLVVREDGMSVRDVNDCLDALYRMSPDVAGYCLNNCKKLENLIN
ncbi:MAG: P-loop NTPase [Oscillospiraceae bacterium]|nr:P-loop NTPase [Oscillospiraceae bacterium]